MTSIQLAEQPDESDDEEQTPLPAKLKKVPLPASAAELQRKSLRTRTLNDWVEDVFYPLYDSDEKFRTMLDAVSNADAVEGATIADDIVAAQMIKKAASDGSPIKRKNLMAIRTALMVVMRRYGIARRERRQSLGGEIIGGEEE